MTNALLSWQRLLLLLALAAGLTLAGCGDTPDDDDDSAGDDDDSSAGDDDDSAGGLANLSGNVTRVAEPVAGQDGYGDLYVVVLSESPMTNPSQLPVAQMMYPGSDFTDAAASVAYSVTGIPPRAEGYFVVAVLDDDGTGPQPDGNDLINFPASVTMDAGGDYTEDLSLTMSVP